jgi:hypothetical protein
MLHFEFYACLLGISLRRKKKDLDEGKSKKGWNNKFTTLARIKFITLPPQSWDYRELVLWQSSPLKATAEVAARR